ncbi:hypothetical protein B0T26DRAFT_756855 [Lasiosphaeria miniovina]|uniref:Uncharacterized protein n=1 Tax=Lasiosphaeria miniovina TaxID=1954250 RepID=A0AA39ZTL6_9PEZI|nr:uncharacterized protein B0T26DRAFT_756855 [Lasiosphaeria miniovina]KAK0703299.1 hypothetical protein B0T26DRAFT_756855 [Lasiosphaeria miniovina]
MKIAKQGIEAEEHIAKLAAYVKKPKQKNKVTFGESAVPTDISPQEMQALEKALDDVSDVLEKQRRPRSHIVAVGKFKVAPLDIRDILSKIEIPMNVRQILDAASRLRAHLNKYIASETHGNCGKTRKPALVDHVQWEEDQVNVDSDSESGKAISCGEDGRPSLCMRHLDTAIPKHKSETGVPDFKDIALGINDVGRISVGYVTGTVNGMETKSIMLNGRAIIECISSIFVKRLGLVPERLLTPWKVSLANDQRDTITDFVVIDVVLGGILTVISAFVYGQGDAFDLILSQA